MNPGQIPLTVYCWPKKPVVPRNGAKAMTQSDALAEPITHEGTIFRKTNVHRGRKVFITPQNSTMQYLCYARTILDQSTPEAGREKGTHETALLLRSGDAEAAVRADRVTRSE